MTIVATTAIDSEIMVVQIRGLFDHEDCDEDDDETSSLDLTADVDGIEDLCVGTQPVPDRAILS